MIESLYRSVLTGLVLPFFMFAILFSSVLIGQEVDTVKIIRAIALEHQLDSMRQQLRAVDGDLQSMKVRLAEGSNLNELLSALSGDEDSEDAPDDQRSKRKRVDALLKAITARPGQLRLNGGATSILQWNPTPSGTFTSATGSVNIFAHTSIGGNTLLFFDFEAIGGGGPDRYRRALTPLNADAGSTQDSDGIDRLNVNEAWMEFSALDEAITFTAGKIDLTNYFDNNSVANDEMSQFISGAFVNSAALPAPGSTPGIRLRSTIFSRIYFQLGFSSVDNSGDNILNEIMKIGSVGFKVFQDTEQEGNIRLYGYLHPLARNDGGYGVSFDQNILAAITMFARWNRNEQNLARWYGITEVWSAGGRYITSLAGKKIVLSAAYGETYPVSVTLKKEQLFELYIRYHINKWSHASPILQLVRNPGGITGDLSLIGIRFQFNF